MIALNTFNNITHNGNEEAEQYSRKVLTEAINIILTSVGQNTIDAIVLIGGYGRGEGGVIETKNGSRPHNNFDLIAFSTNRKPSQYLETINDKLAPIRKKYNIGIDLSMIETKKFSKQSCLVMWYDITHGHKILWGKHHFLLNFSQFELHDIPSWDVRNLMVNRSSLLLINRYILFHELNEIRKKTIIKHFIKATVGYGDALLFKHNLYHWSYMQKQDNMKMLAKQGLVPNDISEYYEEAINFRFSPNYSIFSTLDLKQHNENLIRSFEKIHKEFEQFRLKTDFTTWSEYQALAIQHRKIELYSSFFLALKTIKKCLNDRSKPIYPTKLMYNSHLLPIKELLPITMPLLQYGGDIIEDNRELKHDCREYLQQWQAYIDSNLTFHMKTLGLTL